MVFEQQSGTEDHFPFEQDMRQPQVSIAGDAKAIMDAKGDDAVTCTGPVCYYPFRKINCD